MSYITFNDSIGRTVLGVEVSQDEKSLVVKNPTVVNVQPGQGGQLAVNLIPMFLSELIVADKRAAGTTWTFLKSTLTFVDVDVEPRLLQQYEAIFNVGNVVPQVQENVSGDPSIIKLFDE